MYELHTKFGAGTFETAQDVLNALSLLLPYADISFNDPDFFSEKESILQRAEEQLEQDAFWESKGLLSGLFTIIRS